MKTINLMKVSLNKCLIILGCLFGFNMAMAQPSYEFFQDAQRLNANQTNPETLFWYSDDSAESFISVRDKEGEQYGLVGGDQNGNRFGLKNAHDSWILKAVKNEHTSFHVSNAEMMRIKGNGNVGIGTNNPQHKLEVCGIIRASEVLVQEGWCDFVFEPEYCLTTLEEEEDFIRLYGHLSNFESAKAMNGEINVNDIFKRQQIQIEENVLHLIELNEDKKALENEVSLLNGEVKQLSKQVTTLTNNYDALLKELAEIKANLK